MDIRECTGVIIQKNGMYFVGIIYGFGELKWSNSPYDAWRTRKKKKAFRVAEALGGRMMLFNPVIGKTKEMQEHI